MPPHPITVLDGGLSRDLIALHAPFAQPEWSALALIQRPDLVQRVHEQFIEAGAEVVTTGSYACVPFHIGEERFWSGATGGARAGGAALVRRSGRVAREARAAVAMREWEMVNGVGDEEIMQRAERKVRIAGSLPPIFGSYEPQLFDSNSVQKYLSVLVDNLQGYVDMWLGETLSLIEEGEAVVKAVKETGKPVWISFTLDDAHEDKHDVPPRLRGGETVQDAAIWATKSGVEALLFNCSRPEVMSQAIQMATAVFDIRESDVRLGVYANAFEPVSRQDAANVKISVVREDLDVQRYVEFVRGWIEEGASIVGGCCGIGHGHIRQVAEIVRSMEKVDVKKK